MKVLWLAPGGSDQRRLTQLTFLDEEIEALGRAGVHVVVARMIPYRGPVLREVSVATVPPASGIDRIRAIMATGKIWDLVSLTRGLLHPLWLAHMVRIERHLATVIREHSIDLVHSHFGWPGGFGGTIASALTMIPLVATFRGTDLAAEPQLGYGLRCDKRYDRAVRQVLRRACYTIYFSNFMRSCAISLGAVPERCKTISKGVDLQAFRPNLPGFVDRDRAGLSHAPIILTVCGLVKLKGVDVILRGLSQLVDSHNFHFVICGDGPERESLRTLAQDSRLGDRVTFLGNQPRSRMPAVFASADIFVLASHRDAAPNAILEAMASGVAVVASSSGGPQEYVDHGESCMIVPPGDVSGMAEALKVLLDNPDQRVSMGRCGRAQAESRFSYDRMIQQIIETYHSALGERLCATTLTRNSRNGADL